MATDASICSQALIMLGEQPIASLTTSEGHEPTLICAAVYPSQRDFYLSTYPWRFAMARAQLTRDTIEPFGGGWRYSFQLPPDRASWGGRAAYTGPHENAAPYRHWQIFGDRLLSDTPDIWLEYSRAVHETLFPSYFAHFLAHAVAAAIAYPITDQQNTALHLHRVAFGGDPGEIGGLLLQATIADSQTHPNTGFYYDDDLITARYV